MFKKSLILVSIWIVVSMSLPVEGQEIPLMKQMAIDAKILPIPETKKDRPDDLSDEYSFVACFSVEKQYVPWLTLELTKKEMQKEFNSLVDKSGFKLPSFDALRPFFHFEIGGAIRFTQEHEGVYKFEIYGKDMDQAMNRAVGVYLVSKYGGHQMQVQHQAEELKEQEVRLDNLRIDLLSAQLHVERSEREAKKQYGGLSKEVRTSLESRKWQLEVDLAGVIARINSVEQMQDVSLPQLELIKIRINAQVELAGIMAQKDKIEEILRMADEYDSQVLPHLEQLSELEYEMARTQIAHEQLQKQLQKNEPPKFKVKDDLIIVFPLKDEGK